MSVNAKVDINVRKLVCIGLTTMDAHELADFYEKAFNFRRLATNRFSGAEFERLVNVEGGADSITLGLGDERIELLEFDRPGEPYPKDTSSSDLIFQHFAIVVTDIDKAYQRLRTVGGWTAISRDGPQRLPKTSGGVSAFKFRDPDGHPIELLAFPDDRVPARWTRFGRDLYLGIDHSALSISDSAVSIAFYKGLGFCVSETSLNRGPEQARLDGMCEPQVEVTALTLSQATPHIELLSYRFVIHERGIVLRNNDVASTRLVLEADYLSSADEDTSGPRSLLDPDGHHLLLVSPADKEATTANIPSVQDDSRSRR
jgi:catechol 2,3-dioxygenase-like lactoylglutathione lyase family enzyme